MNTKETKGTKEIAREIRETLKGISGLKLSVTSDYNNISVAIMQAPWPAMVNENESKSVNPYCFMEDHNLTREAKTIFQMIDQIILKYHWDDSDSMTDYFSCAFYYHYEIGRWDRHFVQTTKN